MTGESYATSAEMASELGAFPGYQKNADHMLRVIRNHRRAAYGQDDGYEKLNTNLCRLISAAARTKPLQSLLLKPGTARLKLARNMVSVTPKRP